MSDNAQNSRDPRLHMVAATCIVVKDGKFLIAKRHAQEKAFPNRWTVPGGKLVLAGDTLFRGSIGRTDLWGGDFDTIEQSIRERLYTLDDATIVVTGHGPETEIGLEKKTNQFVRL